MYLTKKYQTVGKMTYIFEQAIHRFSYRIGAVQCNFLTDIFDLVYLRFV